MSSQADDPRVEKTTNTIYIIGITGPGPEEKQKRYNTRSEKRQILLVDIIHKKKCWFWLGTKLFCIE